MMLLSSGGVVTMMLDLDEPISLRIISLEINGRSSQPAPAK